MRLRILPVIVAVLLLAGAGCSRQSEPTPSGDTGTDTTSTDNGAVNGEKIDEDIALTGSVTGPYSVNLEWDPSDEVTETAQKWMIVVGDNENPEYPGNNRFWFQTNASHREKAWKNLPAGNLHFRVCAWTGTACGEYSNDLELEIPGRVRGTK
ncbi:MAG TPA: hypothetical protein PK295_03415 [Candidatus Magasanikbacteria bacterium]|nr:hypothetical protein [Candidatus Magasanikbacteria bacterium]